MFDKTRLGRTLLAVIFLASTAVSQVATGTPPFNSFGGGPFDTVNLGNLNAHFAIPFVHKVGRGMPFTYDLNYDSAIWYPSTVDGTTFWTPVANWGWRGVTEVETGYIDYQITETQFTQACLKEAYAFTYHDPLGVPHNFWPAIIRYLGDHTCPQGTQLPFTLLASDGSGYSLTLTSLSTGTLTSRSGKVISAPFSTGAGAGSAIDANGNEITIDGSGHFFDTLSTAAVLTVAGTAPTPTTFTYTGPSGAEHYTMNYTSYSIHTAFACSGIGEYTGSAYLVSSIVLPDTSRYSFTYEATTGRLHTVTLPTGGTITYTYTGTHNGINCADGSLVGLTRTLNPGGLWQYGRTGSGNSWTTTVTSPPDPQNASSASDITTISFEKDSTTSVPTNTYFETQRVVNQGASTVLSTTITCYNGVDVSSPASCPTVAVASPITETTVFRYLPNSAGAQAETDVHYYNTGGLSTDLPTDVYDYDFGSGAVGPLLRHTQTSYAALGNGIVDHPAWVKVFDGGGTLKAQTTYTYDGTAVTATSSTPQHVSITGARGNLTTSSSLTTGTSTLSKNFTYYDTGTVRTATDVNAALTTYIYGSGTSCGNSFPTEIDLPLTLKQYSAWNCTGAVMTSSTDVNSQLTIYHFTDPDYWRLTEVDRPDGGSTTYTYNAVSTPFSIEQTTAVSSTTSTSTTSYLDGFGRTSSIYTSDPNSNTGYHYVNFSRDSFGQVSAVSNPFFHTGDPTYGITYYAYDALGRNASVGTGHAITFPDGTTQDMQYTKRAVLVTDASGVEKAYQYDGLGRLARVCEGIGAGTQADGSSPVSCSMDVSVTGFPTAYTYDPLGDLTWMSLNGQTRTFTYDYLSRLKTEANPENGTITYAYDGTNAVGDLYQRTFPKPNQTGSATITATYAYDSLHRIKSISFSDGATGYSYAYDVNTLWGVTLANPKGRMVEQAHGSGAGNSAAIFGYDVMGRMVDSWQFTPDALTRHMGYTYNYIGQPLTAAMNGAYTITYARNSLGQLTGVTSSLSDATHPATLYSGAAYNALGEMTVGLFGDGILRSNSYDHMGRLTEIQDGTGPTYRLFLGHYANGNVSSYQDNVTGLWNYTYDAFNRLATAVLTQTGNPNAPAYSYSYDRFGNRWKQHLTAGTGYDVSYTFNGSNHNTTSGFAYDAAGNLTSDGTCTPCWTYDYAGNLVADNGGATFDYDGLGNRVDRVYGGITYDFLLGPSGTPIAEYQGTVPSRFTGGLFTYANNTTYFNRTDHLGTPRLTTDYTGTVQRTEGVLMGPFGDGFSETASPFVDFTGFAAGVWDAENNADHFGAREYAKTQGRWLSPDPAGLAAVDPTNPQTWNRYAYVGNNPVSFVDPSGLALKAPGQGGCDLNVYDCGSSGGSPSTPGGNYGGLIGIVGGPGAIGFNEEHDPLAEATTLDDVEWIGGGPPSQGDSSDPPDSGNCKPLTPGCANVPTLKQVWQHALGCNGTSLLDRGIRNFSLLRLGQTWPDYAVFYPVKIATVWGLKKSAAAAGASTTGFAAGVGIFTGVGTLATLGATLLDASCFMPAPSASSDPVPSPPWVPQ